MKYSEIIRRVRQTTGDTAVIQYTDLGLADWINDAVRECAIENNLLQKSATSNTVVGTTTYALPPDIMKLHSVTVAGEKVRISTFQQFQELAQGNPAGAVSNANPLHAFIWGNQLNLYPAPSSVQPLVIYYIYHPVDWDGVTTPAVLEPPIPQSYHLRIVSYCIAQVALQDEDNAKYVNFMNQFHTGVIDLANKSETEDDLYPFISVSARDMGDYPSLEF